MKRLKDRRPASEVSSVADFEAGREKNLRGGVWACACGCRTFVLIQQSENVKTKCAFCGDLQIIYWNGTTDTAKGSMKRLDTNKWVRV